MQQLALIYWTPYHPSKLRRRRYASGRSTIQDTYLVFLNENGAILWILTQTFLIFSLGFYVYNFSGWPLQENWFHFRVGTKIDKKLYCHLVVKVKETGPLSIFHESKEKVNSVACKRSIGQRSRKGKNSTVPVLFYGTCLWGVTWSWKL